MKEVLQHNESGLDSLKEKLSFGGHLFLDIDGTVKGPKTKDFPSGFDSKFPELIQKAQENGVSVGVCTSQSVSELNSFLKNSGLGKSLFSGISVFEDGHVVIFEGSSGSEKCVVLASDEVAYQMITVKEYLESSWVLADDKELRGDGWGFFPAVATPVSIPGKDIQGLVTMSIWEKGPDVQSTHYQGEYEQVEAFVSGVLHDLGFEKLDVFEAGNGTLRVVEKGMSKATALQWLADGGKIDLGKTVFAGDGLNDIQAAKLIRDAGGEVIAVKNAVGQLKQLASYVCMQPFSSGLVEALSVMTK